MLSHEDDNVAPLLGEGPSHGRSTVVKPVLDETWTEVDELPEADDSEYSDEEVEYIALDLGRDFPGNDLKQADNVQLTNLNTSEPWIRVGAHIMRGRHERMLGSDLLFELPTTDPDSGKADPVTCIATTQARVRFEPVTLHTKSTGNPAVPKQNASSFLAPKATAKPSLSRGRGRGRGRGTGRGRAAGGGSASREGSVASSVHAANSPQMHAVAHTPHVQEDGAVTMQIQEDNRDDGTADGSTNSRAPQDQSDSMPNVEEF